MGWKDVLYRAVWSTAFINSLPDSSFLHILPGGKKDDEGKTTPRTLRMFPFKDASGKIDMPHLRNAVARIKQSNRIDEATKKRLQAKARRMLGSEKSSEVTVFKDRDGQWWFLGIYSNKYMDRDGEILSEEAHKEYIAWLEKTGFRPIITLYHQPRMPDGFWSAVFNRYENNVKVLQRGVDDIFKDFGFAKATRVFYAHGFTYVAAKVLPGKEFIAERLSEMTDMGMSHGFIVKDISDSIVNKYRSFEMSILKRRRAANLLTRTMTAIGEKMGKKGAVITPELRAELTEAFGEDTVAKIENSEDAEKALDGFMKFKEIVEQSDEEDQKAMDDMMDDEEEDEDEEKKEAAPAPTLEAVVAAMSDTFKQVHEVLVQMQADHEKLAAELESLKSVQEDSSKALAEIQQEEDEKIAAQFLPVFDWRGGYSAKNDNKNIITDKKEKEELTKEQPGGERATNSFLDAVFYNPLLGVK